MQRFFSSHGSDSDDSYVPPKLPKKMEKTSAAIKELPAKIDAVRQRQRALGLMDTHSNLFNPLTKEWICAALHTPEEEAVYNDFDYFEHYPEMETGLPDGAPKPPSPIGLYETTLGFR